MRCLSFHQPFASLLVTATPSVRRCSPGCENCRPDHPFYQHGRKPKIKGWETRSWPAPKSIIGTRVAFHAAKKRPRDVWKSVMGPDREFPPIFAPFYDYDRYCDPQESGDGEWWRYRWCGPLGAIVGSGVIARSLPIVAPVPIGRLERTETVVQVGPGVQLAVLNTWYRGGDTEAVITDQFPYGTYEPGRWAWEITDAAPTNERCPACWSAAFVVGGPPVYPIAPCRVCYGEGRCPPIPAVGHQGFWEWTP